MTASVEMRAGPLPGWREVVVDCPHGTTTVSVGGADVLALEQVIGLALGRHEDEEGCGCALRPAPLAREASA
jgi:hypothetical protein